MSRSARFSPVSMACALAAAALLVTSLKFPLWHMQMQSPQYQGQEALHVEVLPGSMRGDLNEIRVLDKYIGVRIPDTLAETRWLPTAICLGAVLGVAAALVPLRLRRFTALVVAALLATTMVVAAGEAQSDMYHIGHDRSPHPVLEGVKNFTPPLLGNLKMANFELKSRLGLGSGCIAGAVALYAAIGLAARDGKRITDHVQPLVQNQAVPSPKPGEDAP